MDIHELYDDIFLSHRPAIIIHFHFCTDGDFGVRLDEDGRGIYSGLAYDTDEIENIDLKEDLVIWNPEDDKVKIYIEALHALKNVFKELIVDYDRMEYVYRWFKKVIDWLTSDSITDSTFTEYMSGNYDGSYIRITLKDILKYTVMDSVYILNSGTDNYVNRGLLINQDAYGATIRYIGDYNNVVEKVFNNNDVFKTEAEAIEEAKKRINEDIAELENRIETYKEKINNLGIPKKINKAFEKYYTEAEREVARQEEIGGFLSKKDIVEYLKENGKI